MKNNKQMSLISVIVPLYNKAPWVKRCIQSIIEQTYQNIEILIINDGSTDNSRQVISAVIDRRIKIFNKPNGGLSSTRNYGIKQANGDYIAFIDADDEWAVRHLEVLLKGFDSDKNIVLVCDDLIEVRDTQKDKAVQRDLPFNISNQKNKYHIIKNYLHTLKDGYFILSGSSVLIKTKTIKDNNLLFYTEAQPAEDINYWIRLKEYGEFVFCNYIGLYYHRIDENSIMNKRFIISQKVPPFLFKINIASYDIENQKILQKFIRKEYFKKAFQNRGLILNKEEFITKFDNIKINKWNIFIYLMIRYCPEKIIYLYKKLKINNRKIDV